ncbi:hypothetical protein DFS34DRAFT_606911 [Phlyctochytrium arcticum]|nr:hypothetical protein DFS34DRAFT_606911 [Phlyctochytrium arcticum]
MPRYQPLSLDADDGTRANDAGAGAASRRKRARTAFYCNGCADISIQLFRGLYERLPSRVEVVGYIAGALFALGWWIFIDGVVFSSTREPKLPNAIRFEDWIPGILSTIALIIVNLIDRNMLSADDSSFSGTNVATKARAWAFVGVSMAIGSFLGAVAIAAMKYIIPKLEGDAFYFGGCVITQSALIFVSSMVLWFGRNSGGDEGFSGY